MKQKIETSTGLTLDKFGEILAVINHQNELGECSFYTWQRLAKSIEGIKHDFDFVNMDSMTVAHTIIDIDENSVLI